MTNPNFSPGEKSGLDVTDHEFLFHDSQTSNLQLFVIGMGFVLAMLDGFDIAAMSYTAHSIGVDLELTADRLGLVFSAALAGMIPVTRYSVFSVRRGGAGPCYSGAPFCSPLSACIS